jgi:hypothetical protein
VRLRPTPLQEAVSCAFECFHEARDRLDHAAWAALAVLVELSQREAARLAFGEAVRATRVEDDE